jgi:hypothetical protein
MAAPLRKAFCAWSELRFVPWFNVGARVLMQIARLAATPWFRPQYQL